MKTNTTTPTAITMRRLAIVCSAQAGTAIAMAALGIVDRFTVYPACYFAACTFTAAWFMRNTAVSEPGPVHSTSPRLPITQEPRPGSL